MCISRSLTEMSLSSCSIWAHLPGYPQRLAKMWGHILVSSYCSRKASTLKRQSVYVTSAPGLVDLKISISNLAGTSHFLSLLPLQPLQLCHLQSHSQWSIHQSLEPPCLGRKGGLPPLTVMHWNFGGLPHSHTAPVWGLSLASVISPPWGSSGLLRCTSHQMARGVRLPCCSNWRIMGRVLCPTSEPSAVRGSN